MDDLQQRMLFEMLGVEHPAPSLERIQGDVKSACGLVSKVVHTLLVLVRCRACFSAIGIDRDLVIVEVPAQVCLQDVRSALIYLGFVQQKLQQRDLLCTHRVALCRRCRI